MLENRVVARQNRFCSYGRQVQQPVTFFDLCCAANQLAYTSQAEKKRFLAIWTIKRLGDSAMNKMHRAGLALVLAACAMPALAQESEQEMRPYVSGGYTYTYQDNDRNSDNGNGRSEEHTSELQSLMRISYAVFCLKKKKQ